MSRACKNRTGRLDTWVTPVFSVMGQTDAANMSAISNEPYAYIKQVLTELPAVQTLEDVEALLPFNLRPAVPNVG